MCDTIVENDEEFSINLISNPAVTLGTQSSTVGVIIDSTGKCSSVGKYLSSENGFCF